MQYTVYRNTGNNKDYPYLLNVQSDLIDALTTRWVIPLFPRRRFKGKVPQHLCPILSIGEVEYLLMTHEMASVRKSMLGDEVCQAQHYRDEIKAAIDFMIDGF
ncbi:CcdB family protein [Limnobaculum parvum]|uniref:Toxin CcdB n=1 Tax=Limnobaculum parvum TaxID=2172103 RepID=A0A2Y9TVY2_9GAMM|nr:CcdB family protein [Limnobaculum parvum]AWH87766.1 cytotoxin [Limnobaculum parvum]